MAVADRLAFLALLPLALAACTVEPENRPPPLADGPTPACEIEVATSPATVSIEPNQRLSAEPGQGAGVFVAYLEDGKWAIDAVCDTAVTGLSCKWDLSLRAVGGTISVPMPQPPSSNFGDLGLRNGAARATFTTTLEWDSFVVEVSPKDAVLELDASLDGCGEPRVVYWQGPDAVHYGAPTNPVRFAVAK